MHLRPGEKRTVPVETFHPSHVPRHDVPCTQVHVGAAQSSEGVGAIGRPELSTHFRWHCISQSSRGRCFKSVKSLNPEEKHRQIRVDGTILSLIYLCILFSLYVVELLGFLLIFPIFLSADASPCFSSLVVTARLCLCLRYNIKSPTFKQGSIYVNIIDSV